MGKSRFRTNARAGSSFRQALALVELFGLDCHEIGTGLSKRPAKLAFLGFKMGAIGLKAET
eukprot:scaffold7167_cov165-Amphora_coffeaeformis.AAC.10